MFRTLANLKPKFAFAAQAATANTNLPVNTAARHSEKAVDMHFANKVSGKVADSNVDKTEKKAALSIGVLGAKGGSGASTVALNLSIAFAKAQENSTLLDANLQQPDIAVLLGQEPEHSLVEFVARSENIDETIFQACSLSLADEVGFARCSLISGPATGSAATQTNLSQLANVVEPLRKNNDFLIVDLPKNLDKHLVTLLDKLDVILIVLEATLTSVAAAKRWLKIFAELGYPQDKLMLVLNRAGARGNKLESDLSNLLSGKEIIPIPNAFALAEECSQIGKPAILKNPKDKYSLAIVALSKALQEFRKKAILTGRIS